VIGLNFRESPPTRSQHIRGDARSRHAGVHPVLVPGGLIEGTTPCEGDGIGFPHNQSSSAAGSRRLLLSCARCY
jgi:hypothetical protein